LLQQLASQASWSAVGVGVAAAAVAVIALFVRGWLAV